jgi:hypothetical protein
MTNEARGEHRTDRLAAQDVAVTGRLASMSREEATARIEQAGGHYVGTPTEATALLVVGLGGPPLDAEGRPTKKLLRAHELISAGAPLRIVPEDEWLELLADDERREELHRLYTTEQLGRVLGVDRGRVRAWVRQGLIRPAKVVRRLCYFDYQEVVNARAVAELVAQGVTAGRLEQSVRQLGSWCGDDGRPLVRLGVHVDAGVVTARLPDGSEVEPSGQLRLRFEEAEPTVPDTGGQEGGGPARLRAVGPGREPLHLQDPHRFLGGPALPPRLSSAFERGVRAEEERRYDDAVDSYTDCVHAGVDTPELAFNLGNSLYALDRLSEAVSAFERAVRKDPEFVEAWNNLGNALTALERRDEAARAFRRALALMPRYADAHYNLAETLLLQGEHEGARRHWRAYLAEDPGSACADDVREKLEVLEAALNRS